MLQEYAPWIALGCALGGMIAGYFMGYRTGRIEGELAALKASRGRQRSSSSRGLPTDSQHSESFHGERPQRDDLEVGHTVRHNR